MHPFDTFTLLVEVYFGAVAQLEERYIRIVEAVGSIPISSTIFPSVLGA